MRLSEVLERRGIHILTNHKIKRRKTSYENAVVFKLSKLYGILHSVNKTEVYIMVNLNKVRWRYKPNIS